MAGTSSDRDGDDAGPNDAVAGLAAAYDELRRLRESLDVDPEELETAAEAYESVEGVLDRWEERATDWDDFQGYVEFRNDLAETLEAVPDDVLASDAIVEADGHVKTSGPSKALNTRDFDAAREALAPAREYAERREGLQAARRRYREAVSAARGRRRQLAGRIDDLERLVRLGEADLEAPIEELRAPIERYNERLESDFAAFRAEAPAGELLGFVATATGYPLVGYDAPPPDLLAYVRDRPAGGHAVDELLEYAGYSRSKLDHYVEDADLLKRHVATNRTYLEGLSPAPLRVALPPPEAGLLRARCAEYVSLVDRFGDEETVAALRKVRALSRREDYGRLRTAAAARADLSDAERQRVASGAVEEELQAAREEYRGLEAALEEYGDLDT